MGCLDYTWDLPLNFTSGWKSRCLDLTWGESADPTDAGSLEKTPFANQASNPATSLIKEPGCMSWHYCFCWALRDTQGRNASFDLIPANISPVRLRSCLGKRREVPTHAGQHKQTLPQSQPSHQFKAWPRNYLTSAHSPFSQRWWGSCTAQLLTGFRAVNCWVLQRACLSSRPLQSPSWPPVQPSWAISLSHPWTGSVFCDQALLSL